MHARFSSDQAEWQVNQKEVDHKNRAIGIF